MLIVSAAASGELMISCGFAPRTKSTFKFAKSEACFSIKSFTSGNLRSFHWHTSSTALENCAVDAARSSTQHRRHSAVSSASATMSWSLSHEPHTSPSAKPASAQLSSEAHASGPSAASAASPAKTRRISSRCGPAIHETPPDGRRACTGSAGPDQLSQFSQPLFSSKVSAQAA